jgi:Ca-activated chloride channel family protein
MRRWFSLWTTLGLCIFGLLGFVYLQDAYAQTPIAVTPIPVDPPLATLAPHSPMPPIGVAYIQSHRVSVTVQDQVAVTTIEQVFVNEGSRPAEGTYLFPLPAGAAVSNLTMIVDGTPIKAQILDAKQAEQIYTQTVRQMRDPALLQYIGQSAIQANVFPIPAGDKRTLQITYSQALTADNGLINYVYPLKTDYASSLPVQNVSVAIDVSSKDTISTVYSPNPLVAVSRTDDNHFKAGFETTHYRATDNFSIYYGIATSGINANLLTYRGSANEDGFFMLMVTPPTKVDTANVIPKDVIIVLDQSGSMNDDNKWAQAQGAAVSVLKRLNPNDRFNAIVFSTGYRIFAKSLQPISEAPKAIDWLNGLEADGGTDINAALQTAAGMADRDRPTVVLFLTDGEPTEGVTEPKDILSNLARVAPPTMRIFAFGVGNDVNTFLLDSLSSDYHGTSVYVRPGENIEEKVSSLYNKIASPVLTNVKLDYGSITTDDIYPATLPDLFAGTQLIVAGRYRAGGVTKITLTGTLNGTAQTYTYDNLTFPDNAGGQPFIPRLWATRKIGTLLNDIRLNGEKPELVDSIVRLSIRYGIITPYTSYLITENGVVDSGGTPPPVMPLILGTNVAPGSSGVVGATAVANAQKSNSAASSDQAGAPGAIYAIPTTTPGGGALGGTTDPIQQVGDRTFVLKNGIWTDTLYDSSNIKLVPIAFLSDAYFKLLNDHPEIKDYLALGDHVIVVVGDTAYEITPDGK